MIGPGAPAFVIGVGGSGPHAEQIVARALAAIADHPLLTLRATSQLWANPAVGGVTSARFVNGAAVVASLLSPAALLMALHAIEAHHGRVRGEKNAARSLDLDLLWADAVVAPLGWPALPHPRVMQRAFALVPAVEAMGRVGLPVPVPWHAARVRLGPEALATLRPTTAP